MRMGTDYRAELIKSLGLDRSQGRILDIGGYDGFLLSKLDAPQKVSVDIETIPLHPDIRYCLGDGLKLPFRDECFDTIYALDILEHVDNEGVSRRRLSVCCSPGDDHPDHPSQGHSHLSRLHSALGQPQMAALPRVRILRGCGHILVSSIESLRAAREEAFDSWLSMALRPAQRALAPLAIHRPPRHRQGRQLRRNPRRRQRLCPG